MKTFKSLYEAQDHYWITDGSFNKSMPNKGKLSLLGSINVHGSDSGNAMRTLSTAKKHLKKWSALSDTKYYIVTLQNGGEGHVVDSNKVFPAGKKA